MGNFDVDFFATQKENLRNFDVKTEKFISDKLYSLLQCRKEIKREKKGLFCIMITNEISKYQIQFRWKVHQENQNQVLKNNCHLVVGK